MDISDRQIFGRWMQAAVEALGIVVEPRQVDRMYQHLNLVLLANEDFNLTRITDPAEAAAKLVGDSLAILPWVARHQATRQSGLSTQSSALSTGDSLRVLDMGTGAGYPSVPVAICRPDWTVTAIDPSGKKIRFVARAAAELGLHNLMTEQIQAREWHGKVAPFDLVITRALGDLSACIREGARLLAPGGCIVSYHAEDVTPEEAKAAAQMQKRYKMQQVDSFEYTLPAPKKSVTRRLIVIGKQAAA
jgi:16S rRNA (guanine527-N7)-methyltransferase